MTQNHRNRSWRGHWTMHPTGTAVMHKSGFVVVMKNGSTGHAHKDKLRPQDDFNELYQRGLRLLDEEYRRRNPEPEADHDLDDDGPEMGR